MNIIGQGVQNHNWRQRNALDKMNRRNIKNYEKECTNRHLIPINCYFAFEIAKFEGTTLSQSKKSFNKSFGEPFNTWHLQLRRPIIGSVVRAIYALFLGWHFCLAWVQAIFTSLFSTPLFPLSLPSTPDLTYGIRNNYKHFSAKEFKDALCTPIHLSKNILSNTHRSVRRI